MRRSGLFLARSIDLNCPTDKVSRLLYSRDNRSFRLLFVGGSGHHPPDLAGMHFVGLSITVNYDAAQWVSTLT
jgi:hypothetical protein